MITITATEFKATCLELFDRVASGALDGVTVTKRGRVVGVLRPPEAPATSSSLFGRMRGTVVVASDVDLTDPVAPELSAEAGLLHR